MKIFPQIPDDVLDEKLKREFIHHQGMERPIKRWDLVLAIYGAGADQPRTDSNSQDRTIRDAIERLRNHGWLILNMNDGRGRFLCASEEEYLSWRMKYKKQLISLAAVLRSMDKAAKVKYPDLFQPSLFGSDVMEGLLTEEYENGF